MTRLLITFIFVINAKLSWYNPALCQQHPINCFNPLNPYKMAAGHDARNHYWRALACPQEFKIGTRFIIHGSRWGLADGEWVCLDRGGAIVIRDDGTVVLDLLTDKPIWGDELPVTVVSYEKIRSLNHCGVIERMHRECK